MKKKPVTNHRPDLSTDDLDKLPRDIVGYAKLKKLEERILEVRRELDAKLDVINRAKPEFENWMDHEITYSRQTKKGLGFGLLPESSAANQACYFFRSTARSSAPFKDPVLMPSASSISSASSQLFAPLVLFWDGRLVSDAKAFDQWIVVKVAISFRAERRGRSGRFRRRMCCTGCRKPWANTERRNICE